MRPWLIMCVVFGGCAHEPHDDSAIDSSDVAITEVASEVEVEIPEGPVEFSVTLLESRSVDGTGYGFALAGRIYEESTVDGTTVGDCTFYPPHLPPFCDPACSPGTVCKEGGVCGEPLEPLGAGDIVVTGLVTGLTLHAETQYFYYSPTFTSEPVDGELFDDDATITATAEGGNVPAFAVSVDGVAELATTLACPPTFAADQDLEVRWTPSNSEGVHFDLESGNHGGQFARIACDTDDSGVLVVDGALIGMYLDAPRPLDLWRLVRANTTDSGRVRVQAGSEVGCRW